MPMAAFDAIVSNFGVHHVPQPILALRQAYRVPRVGGLLVHPAENPNPV
jgi:ubiquinone/menaquinone biosynthesis C-methylase UbiE